MPDLNVQTSGFPWLSVIVFLPLLGAVLPGLPDRMAQHWQRAYRLSLNKWYVDEAYDRTVVRPTFSLADGLWKRVDVALIDGAVNGMARAVAWWGWLMRLFQSGQVQHYALGMMLSVVVMLSMYLLF